MEFFDLRTAYFVMGLLYLSMPVAVWVALQSHHTRTVHLWCGGGALFGMALFLLGLRGSAPAWLTYEAMALGMASGQLLRVQALQEMLQRRMARPWLWGLALTYLWAYALLHHLSPDDDAFFVLSLAFVGSTQGWIGTLAIRLMRQERLRSSLWIAMVYLPLGALMWLQALRVLVAPEALTPMVVDGLSLAIVLMGNLTAVIGNTGFLGVHVERIGRQQLAMAVTQARSAVAQRLGRQIAQLDRVRGMSVISASVAHELSQPLGTLHLTAQQALFELSAAPVNRDRLQHQLQTIEAHAHHAKGVLQHIRRFIHSGQGTLERLDLVQVHASVIQLLKDWMEAEQVALQVQAPTTPLHVQGDAVQLAQVMVNIYRNAIEATAGQSQRTVFTRLHGQDGGVVLEIADNGPGFSADSLQAPPESFFSSKPEGLGMGLLICEQIAHRHEGELTVQNPPQGGALVTLTLPWVDAHTTGN